MSQVQSMPGTFTAHVSASPYQFAAASDGYDAVSSSKNRRSASGQIRPEDKILDRSARVRLSSNAMDLHRNAILFAWAIRRHLDYTTLFDFQPCTGEESLNQDLRTLMERDCRPENCDVGGRHSWNRMRRLAEVRKLLDGDCGFLTLRSRQLQGIESHMVKNPALQLRTDQARWEQGVKLGSGRRAVAYCLTERDQFGMLSERVVPASQFLMLAAFEGRFDQIRGISPIAGALNEFRDVYETKELMAAKVKLDQIFGVAFMRDQASDSLETEFGTDGDTEAEAESDDQPTAPPSYDLGQGIKGFDLDKDEKIELIHSNNPSTQTQQFLELSIAIAIKALDLPFNMFDESHTNFFGSKAAWIQYDRSCLSKREDQLELHRRYTIWRMSQWMLPTEFGGTGEIVLPRRMELKDVKWKWVPRGMPWWNPNEELTVDLMSVAAGLKTLQQVCDERGLGIWSDNLKGLSEEFTKAKELGFTLAFQPAKLPMSLSFGTPIDSSKPARPDKSATVPTTEIIA
jgi:capsid protein